jgi:hypothetical protein
MMVAPDHPAMAVVVPAAMRAPIAMVAAHIVRHPHVAIMIAMHRTIVGIVHPPVVGVVHRAIVIGIVHRHALMHVMVARARVLRDRRRRECEHGCGGRYRDPLI